MSEQFDPRLEILRELYLSVFKKSEDIYNWLNKVYKQVDVSNKIDSFNFLIDELFKCWRQDVPQEFYRKPIPTINRIDDIDHQISQALKKLGTGEVLNFYVGSLLWLVYRTHGEFRFYLPDYTVVYCSQSEQVVRVLKALHQAILVATEQPVRKFLRQAPPITFCKKIKYFFGCSKKRAVSQAHNPLVQAAGIAGATASLIYGAACVVSSITGKGE